jgi:hypothetical protein
MNENEQDQNEQELLNCLRSLASDSPQEAPRYVENRLLTEFRRRSQARRRNIQWTIGGTAAIAAAVAVILWMQPSASRNSPLLAQADSVETVSQAIDPNQEEFYPLPDSEALPPVEYATVVRVQMQMSSLRLIGFPINEDRAAEGIEADVLLGEDGLARGVRLVQ